MINKIKVLYYKFTNNSIIKPRSTGDFSCNFNNKKVYILVLIILTLIFIINLITYF